MKRFLVFIAFFILLAGIPINAQAVEKSEYSDYLSSFDLSSFENLDDGTKKFLDEMGLSDFDYDSITNLSFEKVISYIVNLAEKKSEGPLKSGITVFIFIVLLSLAKSFAGNLQKSSYDSLFETVTNLIIAVFLATRLEECISICCSTVKLCADFTYAFFPAYSIIVAASGGTMTSFSVNTTILVLAQGMNVISKIFFIPITNCFLALGVCSSIRKELQLGGIISALKGVITTIISSASAVFVSILSVKTAVASRADALGLRSVRFAINSVVPVIGSSISEGLLSIQSYSSLIKTSVGVVGIISVCVIFLPSIIEISLWRLSLSAADIFSQMFFDNSVCASLKAFKDTLLIITVILILSMLTTVVSIGILVAARTMS